MSGIWSLFHKYVDRLPTTSHENRIQRYGFVILINILFLLLGVSFETFVGKDVPFLFAVFIVILSAWAGGFGPGILATILAGVITYYFFLSPKLTLFGVKNISNILVMLTFFLEGFFISIMSETHRRSDMKKSEFLGVISHELKNPLTSIKGYAEMIKKIADKSGEKKLSEFAQRIDRQVMQVTEMINEMLDITKIETGRLTYHDEDFKISGLVKEIVSDQQVTTDTHKIILSGTSEKVISGDRYRIGQIITNLLSNAIKYASKSKKIQVKLENTRTGVTVSVQDFGSGISKKDQEKLFTPFFRATSTNGARGTGLGLFISLQIAKRHQGILRVKSTKGKGSTFYLDLPSIDKKKK